jgi:hypothetical protein
MLRWWWCYSTTENAERWIDQIVRIWKSRGKWDVGIEVDRDAYPLFAVVETSLVVNPIRKIANSFW